MSDTAPVIVFALYPGVTHLDFTGPHQVLSALPGATAIAASATGEDIGADGLVFTNLRRLADIEACDVICVPGGFGCAEAMLDAEFISQIRRLAAGARYVTSVCTGSLILGAAGLLQGKRAACHWAWRDMLSAFGAIPDPARVVRDGNILTGGGVTAGIDFGFALLSEMAGEAFARQIQLGLEYAPAPPFNCGRPETADAETLARVTAGLVARREIRTEAVKAAGAVLQSSLG